MYHYKVILQPVYKQEAIFDSLISLHTAPENAMNSSLYPVDLFAKYTVPKQEIPAQYTVGLMPSDTSLNTEFSESTFNGATRLSCDRINNYKIMKQYTNRQRY